MTTTHASPPEADDRLVVLLAELRSGRRLPAADVDAAALTTLVRLGLARTFRDGAELWIEVDA